MTAFCGLYITTDCGGQMGTLQDGVFNGRPQYIFTFTFNGNIINGRIYWNPDEGRWYVEDATSGQNISYLPFDRPHPDGTVYEWENVSLLSYGCLSNSNSFQTDWFEFCPPTYFEFCCTGPIESDNFIGLQSFEYYGYYGTTFYLESPQFSGCATLIDSSIPLESIIYSSVDTSVEYNSCIDCTLVSGPCYTQPVYTTPTPIPVLTADTECGGVSLVNECLPISIPLMSVLCNTVNVTSYGGNNGSIELIISGGTPPYNIIWKNGNTGYNIYNLTSQRYEYTVVDYYGDYVINSSCLIQQPPIPTPRPPLTNMCMTIQIDGEVFRLTLQVYESNSGGKPGYSGEGYDIIWNSDYDIPYWSIEGPIVAGDMVNYNPDYPPLTGWVWLIQNTIGSAEGTLGNCENYGDFCLTLNVNSFVTQPYRIQFQQSFDINGQPSWFDTTGVYNVIWTTTQTNNPPFWSLIGLPSYFTNPIVNNNPTVPPLNGWNVLGTSGNIETNGGNCFSEYVCASFQSFCDNQSIELVLGETIDNNPVWYGILPCGEDGNFFIYWDESDNYWSTSGLTSVPGYGDEARRISQLYIGPFGTFNTEGDFSLSVSEGRCNQPGRSLTITTTNNYPIIGSDGGIVIEVDGGTEPYEYSVDNGTTYRNLPIFYGLKSGTYVVSVKDSNGVVSKISVILNPPQPKTVYQVSLNTSSERKSNTTTVTTTEYTTIVSVVPPLPLGTEIIFDLVHTDNYNVSPYDYSATLTSGSLLIKNGSEIIPELTEYDFYSEINTTVGCQNYSKYITATTETWQGITMVYGDNIIVTTTVSVLRNGRYPCYSVINIENYSLFNLSITGCGHCEVLNQQGLPTISPKPPTTPTNTNTNTALT